MILTASHHHTLYVTTPTIVKHLGAIVGIYTQQSCGHSNSLLVYPILKSTNMYQAAKTLAVRPDKDNPRLTADLLILAIMFELRYMHNQVKNRDIEEYYTINLY